MIINDIVHMFFDHERCSIHSLHAYVDPFALGYWTDNTITDITDEHACKWGSVLSCLTVKGHFKTFGCIVHIPMEYYAMPCDSDKTVEYVPITLI